MLGLRYLHYLYVIKVKLKRVKYPVSSLKKVVCLLRVWFGSTCPRGAVLIISQMFCVGVKND